MTTTVSETVCVTGAGGYIASWLVKLLLSKGYSVHGTVRRLGDDKYAHLIKLENADRNLKLVEADLLDPVSISRAITGCSGVFHVASPVPSSNVSNPQAELIQPAVDGTKNVLAASLAAKIKRVVVVSSIAAVFMNPSCPKNQVMDEDCWSDKDYCKATNNWYCLSKTEAEMAAFEFAESTGLDVITVCPSLVFGPLLQPIVNASSLVLVKLVTEGYESRENKERIIVDVRDVADSLILVYEKAEAKGRYICTSHKIRDRNLVEKLRNLYPNYNYPKRFTDVDDEKLISSEKLQKLGWRSRSLEETLVDSIESLREARILN